MSESFINSYDQNDKMSEEEVHIVETPVGKKQSPAKRQRRHTSDAWKDFDIVKEGDKSLAQCKHCDKKYVYNSKKSGTTNLLRHTEKCPRRNSSDVMQLLMSQQSGSLALRPPKIDPEMNRSLLAAAIVKHELPFRFVEFEGIREWASYLNPDVKHISRNTAKADVIKLFRKEKESLRATLQSCGGRIGLTSDLWTSMNTDGYICLTVHFIDKKWTLHKRVLSFSRMPPPHTGMNIAEKVIKLLVDWGIEMKISSITLDNASNNDSFVEYLRSHFNFQNALLSDGKYLHVRCCAHILNIIVQEGLKMSNETLEKIRNHVKYVKASQHRKTKFIECIEKVKVERKKGFRQDVPTRWNSTYLMLDSALYYKEAVNHYKMVEENYKFCPCPEEWKQVEKISNFLKIFYEVTLLFSGSKYPTANLYFQGVFKVQMRLRNACESDDATVKEMARKMQIKFDKYWAEYSPILAMAVALDPRCKLSFVQYCFQKVYPVTWSEEVASIRVAMISLYEEYLRLTPRGSTSSNPKPPSTFTQSIANSKIVVDDDDMQGFASFTSTSAQPQISELDLFLQEPMMDLNTDLDILNFWKSQEYRYPSLSQMARDILTIPISTVSSESAFSVGGRVINDHRCSLTADNIEAIITTRDWLYGTGG